MASKTTNYGLNKHSPQDFYDVNARNDNWDKIDEALAATDPTKITAKAELADGDGVMIADSADGGKAKRLLWSNVKTALGKLFVPLARKINGKTLSADVTLTGENIAVSTADSTPISGAVKYRSNPNLLDNWYFCNPINQREKTEYAADLGVSYCIDRWKQNSSGVKINSGSISIGGAGGIFQILEYPDLLVGHTITFSVLTADNKLYYGSTVFGKTDFIFSRTDNLLVLYNAYFNGFQISPQEAGATRDILAAKLELGDAQTLAHKEGDKWVLNEIPDFGEQLRR